MTDERREAEASIWKLTGDQGAAIELEVGKPFDQWLELPSRFALAIAVYSAVMGVDRSVPGAMPGRELLRAVGLMDAETAEDAETEDPT